MDNEKVQQYLMVNADKFPSEKLPFLKNKLEEMSDDKLLMLTSVELKSPTVSLVFALLLGGFGADRFYMEEVGLGVAKLLTAGGCGIWAIIDWFTAMNRAKEYNFNKIMMLF